MRTSFRALSVSRTISSSLVRNKSTQPKRVACDAPKRLASTSASVRGAFSSVQEARAANEARIKELEARLNTSSVPPTTRSAASSPELEHPDPENKRRCAQKQRAPLEHFNGLFTRGVCVDPTRNELLGGSHEWEETFRRQFHARGLPTLPLLECPLCGPRHVSECRGQYTPLHLESHLTHCHSHQGCETRELTPHNDRMLAKLQARFSPLDFPYKSRADTANPSSSSQSSCVAPAQLIIWVDVANVEMGAADVILEVLRNREVRQLLARVPVAVCTMHEMFVPFRSRTLAASFALANLHPHSDFFPFYAATHLESGDLASAAILTQLRLPFLRHQYGTVTEVRVEGAVRFDAPAAPPPPVLLLTMDRQQKMCSSSLFGFPVGNTAPHGCVVVPRSMSTTSVVQALKWGLATTGTRTFSY